MSNLLYETRVKCFVAGFVQQSTISSIDPAICQVSAVDLFCLELTDREAYDVGRLCRYDLWTYVKSLPRHVPPIYLRDLDPRLGRYAEASHLLWVPLYQDGVLVNDWTINVLVDFAYDSDAWDNTYEAILGGSVEYSDVLFSENCYPSSLLYLRDIFAGNDDAEALRPINDNMAFHVSPLIRSRPTWGQDDTPLNVEMRHIIRFYSDCVRDNAVGRWTDFIRDTCVKFKCTQFDKRWVADYLNFCGFLDEDSFENASGADGFFLEAIDFWLSVSLETLPPPNVHDWYKSYIATNAGLPVGGCQLLTVVHPGVVYSDVGAGKIWFDLLWHFWNSRIVLYPGVVSNPCQLISALCAYKCPVFLSLKYVDHGKFPVLIHARDRQALLEHILPAAGSLKMVSFVFRMFESGLLDREYFKQHFDHMVNGLLFPTV